MSDLPGNIVAKLFLTVVGCFILLVATLVAIVVLTIQSRDQSERNQRHIDCIVALGSPVLPKMCEPVKAQLIEDGIIPPGYDRSTTTITPTLPTTSTTLLATTTTLGG